MATPEEKLLAAMLDDHRHLEIMLSRNINAPGWLVGAARSIERLDAGEESEAPLAEGSFARADDVVLAVAALADLFLDGASPKAMQAALDSIAASARLAEGGIGHA